MSQCLIAVYVAIVVLLLQLMVTLKNGYYDRPKETHYYISVVAASAFFVLSKIIL